MIGPTRADIQSGERVSVPQQIIASVFNMIA
jgi:hypothetical protein